MILGLQNGRGWAVFCDKVLGQPGLARDARFDTNARRNTNRHELKALIEQVFAPQSAQEVVARLDAAQIANAKVNTMAQLWAHPQLRARARMRTVASPVGPLDALLPPGAFDGFEARMDAIPAVGEHTESILRELGRDDATIQRLRQAQAI